LSRLINNVLELSRLEKQDRPLQVVTGDIRAVVRETLEVLRPHAEKQGFSLHLDLAERLGEVRFESDALRQVLFNLIDNGLKYSRDAADKRLIVTCGPTPTGVSLSVRDYGPGVEPEHLGSIFDAFYRGERELTRKHTGTGIGLSLVRGLCERMGGKASAKNEDPGFSVTVHLATPGAAVT
jgi:two-component system phosphate regulon sensor histidine kinase PhoR